MKSVMKYNVNFDIEFTGNSYGGLFVAIEGIDGSGKTTQAELVVKKLKEEGYKVIYTKEPTDEPTGKFIRKILSGELKLPAVSLQYLFGADRAVHLEEIKKLLQKKYIVVTDRYFWSSVAYGVADMKQITDFYLTAFSLLSFYHRFMVPDISFFLDVSADAAYKRIEGSEKHKDIYDDPEKLPMIKNSYEYLMKKFKDKFTIIDGERSIEAVTEELVKKIVSSIQY